MYALYQSHIGSWAFLVVLFFVAYFLLKGGKIKGGTIVHMILRLFYLIMLITGIGMILGATYPVIYHVKALIAIILIGMMEMLLGRTKKGTIGSKAPMYLGIIIILFIVVILIGFGVISF